MFNISAASHKYSFRNLCLPLVFAGLILSLFSISALAAKSPSVSREKGKATFIYNIFRNLHWPEEEQLDHLKIGLYGKDSELMRELKVIFSRRQVRGKRVELIQMSDLKAARSLQVLIVTVPYNRYVNEIATKLRRSQTLLITEDVDDKRNVMINFISPSANLLAFEVNRSSIVYEGITLSKDILLFGGTELDIAVIHKETEAELAKAISAVQKQREEMAAQQGLLEAQSLTIVAQKKDIDEQHARLAELEGRIKQQREQISIREIELFRLEESVNLIREALNESEGVLSERESVLAKKEADINTYSARIRENLNKLNLQKREIKEQEKLIVEKNAVLSQQVHTIKNQQFILIAAVIVLLTFLALVVGIFKSAQAKHRVNKKLKHKTHELEAVNEKLLQVSEAKSQFVSAMSHEIRTPLNGVLGMVELLQDTPVNEQQRHYLNTVHSSGEMLLGVINDILDYSKIEAGKMPIESIEFDLEKLIFDCAMVFAHRMSAELSFIADIDGATPRHLMGDPTRIRQILLNLLSNAFKFTSAGEIGLRAQTSTPVGAQAQYSITVSDSGVGLSKEQCDKIFNAFTQADSSTTRRYGGTGLGLVISMRLAKLMGGSITVSSELGVGSSFTLSLPQTLSAQVESAPDLLLAGLGLLIVDSNLSRRQVLYGHTSSWHMKVTVADTLASMRQVLEELTPAVIIIAESLEHRDGLSLAVELARELKGTKVILQSSIVAPVEEERLSDMGIAAVLEMPVAPSLLRKTLLRLLRADVPVKASATVEKAGERKQYRNARVLVVEDNAVNQIVIKGMLAKVGIEPEVANNGLEAVNCYREKCAANGGAGPYDIILMDCEMPVLDGLDATRQIREFESLENKDRVAIVALTAHAMDGHKQNTLEAGMDEHLTKPLNFGELQKVLSHFVP